MNNKKFEIILNTMAFGSLISKCKSETEVKDVIKSFKGKEVLL